MVELSDVFEKNYQEYCARIARIDFESIKNTIGIVEDNDRMLIPFFNNRYRVSNSGIADEAGNRPGYIISVVLSKYILLCPERVHHDPQWASFKDFKRTSHFTNVNYFSSDTEKAVEKHFSGRLNELAGACEKLGGSHHDMGLSYDLSMQFDALRISLLLLFNDGDEEFPAKCTVLFQKHSEYYLDPESLAVTSAFLASSLKGDRER